MDPTAASSDAARFWVFALVAAVVAAGVIVGIVVYGGDDGSPPATTVQEGDAPDSGATADEPISGAQREQIVEDLVDATERLRGLRFLQEPDITFLNDAQFRERLRQELNDDLDAAELADVERIWQALDLIDDDVSLEQILRQALGEGVLGFYEPEADQLVMRGVDLDPYTQSTLVHELVHALDDQHFDLHRPDLSDGDDTEAHFGFTGLVEGTARWVENQWLAELGPEELQELRAAEARFGANADLSGIPEVLLVDLSLPYVVGPTFVGSLVVAGGTDAIDAAYLEPPVTGEQLFEPSEYLESVPVVEVAAPPADGEVVSEGVLGASTLYELLLFRNPGTAAQVALAWGGDRYVVWVTGDDSACVRADMRGDDDEATEVIRGALGGFAAAHPDASVEMVDGIVRLTACG